MCIRVIPKSVHLYCVRIISVLIYDLRIIRLVQVQIIVHVLDGNSVFLFCILHQKRENHRIMMSLLMMLLEMSWPGVNEECVL